MTAVVKKPRAAKPAGVVSPPAVGGTWHGRGADVVAHARVPPPHPLAGQLPVVAQLVRRTADEVKARPNIRPQVRRPRQPLVDDALQLRQLLGQGASPVYPPFSRAAARTV